MASVTILSDNGATSGSAGLKTSGGNDGVLILQTTTSGGTATNAVYVNTSQNVGLGTTPAAKLHLLTTGNTTADGVRLTFGSEARSHNIYSALPTGRDLTIAPYRALTINTGSGTNEGVLTLNAYEYTVFGTGSSYTERMRLDSSGNLGLGVTPSAWSSGLPTIQVGATASINSRGNQATVYNNVYFDGTNFRAITTGFGGRYRMDTAGGSHAWDIAASVTAGSIQSVTQAMTLDASGNLGVGTSSPTDSNGFSRALDLNGPSGAAYYARTNGSSTNYTYFGNYGTSGYVNNVGAGALLFFNNGSERMRIDSSGNLLVGTANNLPGTNTARANFYSAANTLYAATSDASFTSDVVRFGCMRTASSAYNLINCYSGNGSSDVMSVVRMYVRGDGGIGNYQANNVNLSDRREKTNFAPAGDYLSKICAIPVQTFNYIDQNLEEDDGLTLGVVAQDVQAVAPELVTETNWGSKEEPKMRLSIYQTDLQYALMKCIQEQQAIIEQLQADVAALKGQA